jgi:AsmA protein
MKALKYALVSLLAILLVAAIAVGVVIATFNPNDYKPQIVQLVKDKTGRTLKIEGDIGLKFFPKIGAGVGKASLSERAGDKEFAGIDEAQVYVALLPLLSKQVVVDEVRIDGLRANLVRFKDGTTNFSDLVGGGEGKPPEPSKAPPPAGPGKPVQLDVSGVRIRNAHLGWKDQTTGNDLAVQVRELKTGRIADKSPSKVELDMSVKGAQPKLDLAAKLAGTLTFDLGQQLYTFRGLDAKVTGSALDFSGIAVTLKADVESNGASNLTKVRGVSVDGKAAHGTDSFDVKLTAPAIESGPQALSVDGLTLTATGAVAGMQLTQASLKAPKVRMNLARSEVKVDGVALTAQAKSASDNLDVNLSVPKLDVTPERAAGESALLTAKLTGAQRNADVKLALSALEGSAKALKIAALKLDVDAKADANAIKGTLTTPVAGNLEARVFELPKVVANFHVTSPSIPQKTVQVPLNGSVRADLSKEAVGADLTMRFDESNIKAKLALAKFAAPAYNFDIDIDKLNLDRYLPPAKKEPADGKPATPKPKEPEKPIDLSALKPLNANGNLKIGQFQANNVKLANLRVGLRAAQGKLDLDPLSANLYEGSVAGTAAVDANANRFAVNEKLTGVSIGPLLRDAANQDILDGKGNVALNVTTAGNLVSAIKRALNGKARVELRDGAVKGIDIPGAIRSVKAKFGAKDTEGSGSAREKTEFSELSATFDIKNGVAHNEDLILKSPLIRVGGAGDVNIGEDSVNYVVKASIVGSLAGQGGKELGELKGLTVPVRVSGPYDQLKYKVEFSQMLGGASKEQLESAKEMAKGALKSQLKDLMGGQKEAAPGGQAQPAAPAKPSEDELKQKLKGLFK